MSAVILDFCGIISYLPFAIALRTVPRKITFTREQTLECPGVEYFQLGNLGYTLACFSVEESKTDHLDSGEVSIADIMMKKELLHLRRALARKNMEFHHHLPSLHLSRWYEALDLRLHENEDIATWTPNCQWPKIGPEHSLDDVRWMVGGAKGERHLDIMHDEKRPSGGFGLEWMGFHFGLISLDQVKAHPGNVLNAITSKCWETARAFIRRGDFTEEDKKNLLEDYIILNSKLDEIKFMVEEGILDLEKLDGRYINSEDPHHVKWFIERGVSMVSVLTSGEPDSTRRDFVIDHRNILPPDHLAVFLASGFSYHKQHTLKNKTELREWIEFVARWLVPSIMKGSENIAVIEMMRTGKFEEKDVEMRVAESISRGEGVNKSLIEEYVAGEKIPP